MRQMPGRTPFSSLKLPATFLKIPRLFLSNLVTFPLLFHNNSYINHASGIADVLLSGQHIHTVYPPSEIQD